MMEVTLHPAPRWRDVVLEQVRIVGLSIRREALIAAAVVLGGATVVIVGELIAGGPGFDGPESLPTALVSFLFPFAVWRSDKRFGAAFLWTLPVSRRRLALARVFAGGVWLLVFLAVFAAWLLVLVLLAHASSAQQLARIPFIATMATYLLGSALVLGLRHPLRWLLGAAGVFMLLGGLSQALEARYGVQTLLGSRELLSAAVNAQIGWLTPNGLAQWAITALLSWGLGLIALWAAASRHVERRRH
jgi:hypothetical protein